METIYGSYRERSGLRRKGQLGQKLMGVLVR